MSDTDQRIWASSDELASLDRTTDGEYRLRVDRAGSVAVSDKLPPEDIAELHDVLAAEVAQITTDASWSSQKTPDEKEASDGE